MKKDIEFSKLAENVYTTGNGIYRIGDVNGLLTAYLIETSIGLVQINTVPELFKTYFPVLKKLPTAIFASAPKTNELGDSYTGFEFELWVSRFMDFLNPNRIKFISSEKLLKQIYSRLEIPMNGNYVEDENGTERSKFVPKRWVDDVFDWCPLTHEFNINHVKFEYVSDHHLRVFDKKKLVFDSELFPSLNLNGLATDYVNQIVSSVADFNPTTDELKVVVAGTSIGTKPGVTSNFIIYWNGRLIWIDPPARCVEKGVQLGINLDHVQDFLISHVHEDHIEGFSSILQRKINRKEKVNLLSSPDIYNQLKIIYKPNFGDITQYINFQDVTDRSIFKNYHGLNIETRINYHPVPTLGFKFEFNSRKIGISGDILYKESILHSRTQLGVISDDEYQMLAPDWFRDCEILLHDTTVSGDPVHTALQDVEFIASKLPKTRLYGYHSGAPIVSKSVRQANFGDIL